jgi:protein translocase SecG subunit
MLYNLLLVLLIIDGLILAVAVLLQAGQGGGLASMGGGTTDMVLGGRQAVTILHKASWVTGALFMFLAVLLSIVGSQTRASESAVQRQLRQQQAPLQQVPNAPLQTVPPAATPAGKAKPPVPPAPPPAAPVKQP